MHGFAYNPLKGFYTKPANGWTRDIEQKTFELPFLKPLLLTVHSPEVIGFYTMNFRPKFKFLPLSFFGDPRSRWVVR